MVKLSWAAIFGGVFVALGVTVLLVSVGLAIGLSAINPAHPASAKAAGIGTGIWTLIVPIVALFFGGLVASRTAGPVDRVSGTIHGAVLWGLTTLMAVMATFWVMSGLGGLAMKATTGAVGMVGQTGAMAAQQGGSLATTLGVDENDLLTPVNNRLRAQGKPTVTPAQLESASKDAVNTAIRDGRMDRNVLLSSLAEHTRLSRADANEIAGKVEQAFDQRRQQFSQTVQNAQTSALKAADFTGGAMGWVSLGLFLGLVAAVGAARH